MRKPLSRKIGLLLIFSVIAGLIISSEVPRVASADGDSVVIAAGDSQGVVDAIQTANQRGAAATPYRIYLAAGDYAFYAPDQDGQPSLPEVTGNLAIYGQNTQIALNNSKNALENAQLRIAAGVVVELHNLVFLVQSGSGRAILNRGTLVISDSQFGESLGEGGGIENQHKLTLERTQFTHNQYVASTEPGGALYNNGVLTATCARFVDGLASQGGAIFNTAWGKAIVTKSAFDGNRANGGGAIFNDGSNSVMATDNWWSTGTPGVDDRYRGVDTVSSGVIFDPTASTDPTQGADCQPQAPSPVSGTPVGISSSTPTPGVSAPAEAGQTRVIVGLKTAFAPSLSLSGTQAAQEQKSRILQTGSELLASLQGLNVTLNAQYTLFPYLALTVDVGALQALSNSPLVASIQPDRLSAPTDNPSTLLTGAQNTWGIGYDGTGWTVGILDTGVDKTHPFLTGKVVSEACFSTTSGTFSTSLCPSGVASSTAPDSGLDCPTSLSGCGHGTHVAGIAAGLNGSFGRETFSGMARGAHLIAIKVFSQINDSTTCTSFGRPTPCALTYDSDQLKGVQHVATLTSTYSIAAINMSLGGGLYTTQAACDAAYPGMKAAIDTLRSSNVATIIASGNNGVSQGVGSTVSITAPACISTAVSVGATNFSDVVAGFSNSVSFLSLLAPGVNVLSSYDGSYTYLDGTSMATPQVTGAWAILKQRMPGATVTQILTALRNTGVPVLDTRNGVTTPRIQVDAALNSLGPITVTDTVNSGTTSLRAALTFANTQNSLTTINFNIAGTGVKTIWPTSALPTITKPVVIDGYTQPGALAATSSTPATVLIMLDGVSAGASSGLTLTGGNSTVRGLAIDRFAQNGITLTTSGGNTISGNYIGVNADGTTAAANGTNGVAILSGANNIVGGTTVGAPNIIAYNSAVGVAVTGTSGNNILTNRIFSNTGLGIDLLSGANGGQAAPVLTSAVTNTTTTLVVGGTLNSTASTTFRLEFFSNTSCDSSGAGEGEIYLGTANTTTDGSGSASFSASLSAVIPVGRVITATAGGSNGTSEFSACLVAFNTPINTNLARNGDFASGTAQWSLYGEVSAAVTSGVMNLSRQNPSPTGALIYQDTNYQAQAGFPLEVSVDLGNSSSVTKQLTVYLRRPDWGEAFNCVFTLAPNTSLTTYRLRAKTSTAWSNMHLELAPDPADNLPAILVDNVNVQYKPSLNPTGVECVVPVAPANVNLVRNGTFASGTAQWSLYGEVSAMATGGVMNLSRQSPSPTGALIYQDTNYQALTGSPLEVAIDLGNSSSVPKQLTVYLRRPDWTEAFRCVFNLAPGAGMATYTLRAKTSTAWPNMHLELAPDPADNAPAIQVDNVNVQYKPSLNPSGVECSAPGSAPANVNLARNGDFASGTAQWGLYGEVSATVVSGVMNLYRQNPSPNGALIYQDTNSQALTGSSLEVAVDLGNSSSVPKQLSVRLRRLDWGETFSCAFNLAPNTGLATYTLRAKTSTAWPNMHLEVIADPADNTPAILVDNVNVQYKPSLNPVGVECTTTPAPANANLVRNGDFALGTDQWGLYGEVNATVTSGVMTLYRPSPSPTGALIYQDTNYQAAVGSPLELAVDLGNSSSVPKQMTLYLRRSDWNEAFSCVFRLAPNTGLTTYTLRAKTSTAWSNMHLELIADPADNTPAILVDNVNVQYKPSLNPVGVECTIPIAPANFNLVRNGDFALGTAQWGLYGNVSATVTSGVMNLYRQNPSPTGALIYQDTNFQVPTGSPLEMTVNLGNSSSVPKQMTLYLRKPDWSEAFRCVFSLAPNTSLATYTLRGKTSTAWPNMHLEVVPDPADGVPAILVDNVNVQYKPSLNPVGVECAGPN